MDNYLSLYYYAPKDISKTTISQKVLGVIKEVNNGDLGGDEVLLIANVFEQIAKELKGNSNVREAALKEIENGKTDLFGHKLSVLNSTQYDYSNSPAWVAQKAIVTEATAELKEIEEKAKATKNTTTHILTATGEQMEVVSAIKRVSTVPIIKIKK